TQTQRTKQMRRAPQKKRPPLILRFIRGLVMVPAHAMGGAVRHLATGAREVPAEVRRDGVAIVLIILAILIAAREWFALSSWAGTAIHWLVAGTFGILATALPLVLLAMAVRLMRAPQDGDANYRITVGGLFL